MKSPPRIPNQTDLMAYRLALYAVLLIAGFDCARPCGATEDRPVFEQSIQPIFALKCGKCHSEKVQKGALDLSSIRALQRGGESGETLVAKTIEESWLWEQLGDGQMPPEGEPPLTDEELAMIRQWIISGAAAEHPMQQEQALTQHDVLPIVLLRCTACHGPRLKQGGLDLRTRAGMLAGGKSGPALVAGDAEASLMIQRIESEACPPRELLLKYFVRRPPQAETAKLRQWIDAGAPEVDVSPDVATTAGDPLVSDEDRQHWAFQPPKSTSRFESIDEFVLAKLRERGLDFSPTADRDTLIRRAHVDLLGLPPSLAELRRWQQSRDPNWYAQMIDQLLASPHYGERWGRYWLDLAGYADSEGGISADPVRPVAWKYRDYVIDAFNSDKPYDRFLLEQIAGDELVDYENAPVVNEQMVQNLVATGFLRMGIDETGSRTMNFVPERLKVISDAITVVSSGVMGLTMECARCHSHKYDPIPHRDYYRFKAIFQGALDEHDWSSFKTRKLNVATPQHRQRVAKINPPLAAKINQLAAQQKKLASEITDELLRHHYPELSAADRQQTLLALKVADNNRTLPQKILVEQLQTAELLPDDQQPESVIAGRRKHDELQREIERIERQMVPPLAIRALWDFGRPSPTYVLRRGEHDKPGKLVGPGVPSVLTDGKTPFLVQPPFADGTAKTGRRLALARWLVAGDHPLTSRVMVNRLWYRHFGTGLVKDLENFGLQGERPSHPELLDWLALQFVDRGWSIKQMHRLIMKSRTYRQSSRVTAERRTLDPDNRLLSRWSLRRLDAEALRDSLLFVAGRLDDTPGGIADTVSVNRDGLVSVNPTDGGGWRRSVYLQYRRTEIPTMMDTFDYPQMGPNCIARNVSTVSPQSLMLMNNGHIRQLAAAFADNVEATVAKQREQTPSAKVDAVYRIALTRPPSDQERQLGINMLKKLEAAWLATTSPAVDASDAQPVGGLEPAAFSTKDSAQHQALVTYCHTILNSAAFLYID
jgi:hypothetical protein